MNASTAGFGSQLSTTGIVIGSGAVIGAGAIGVDLGLVSMIGIVICIPVFAAGVWLFPKLMQRYYLRYQVSDGSEYATKDDDLAQAPGILKSLPSVLLAPVLLIIGTIGKAVFSEGSVGYVITQFFGNTVVALLLSALYALIFLGLGSGMTAKKTLSQSKTSLKGVVNVLLIIGAGGGLKEMLQSTGLSDQIATTTAKWAIPTVLLAWLIAALFRVALGSGTVAVAAAAGIVAPMVAQADDLHKALAVLAIAVGAMIFSHVNDGGAAAPGLLTKLWPTVDGVFLGRFAHDPAAFLEVVKEAWRLISQDLEVQNVRVDHLSALC